MAATKLIDAMTAAAALGGTEEIPGVQSAANVKITAAQIKTFTSASPTLVTPVLGVATATSVAIGGATIGSNALAVAGTGQITGKVYVGSAAPTSSNYALWKDGSNRLWVNADDTNGTVSVGVADDYGVTYTGPAYAGGRGWRLNSDVTFGWSATNPLAALDTGLSRISAGVIGVGTGAQGSVAGGLQAATLALGGATIGSYALAVTGGISNSSTALLAGGGFVARSDGQSNLYNAGRLGWTSAATGDTAADLILTRGAAATLQHGAADAASPVAQTIKFQDVIAGTSNTAGVNATIQAPAGTGTGAGGSLIFQVAPAGSAGSAKNAWATALTIDSVKNVTMGAAKIYNVDGSYQAGSSGSLYWASRSSMLSPSDGVIGLYNNAATDFGRLQFGGTTSSFPALKRSTTSLQARLADDSAFTAIQGKLTTDTAYTAGDPTTTGYLVVYDSTGTAYRVPALAN